MLYLYQIGDIPIYNHLVGLGDEGVELERNYTWDAPTETFAGTGSFHSSLSPYETLQEQVEYKITGAIYDSGDQTASQIVSRIGAMSGRVNTPVIAMRFSDNPDNRVEVDWLESSGVIVGNKDIVNYSGTSIDAAHGAVRPLDMTVLLEQPWRRLSPWYWEYRDFQEVPTDLLDAENVNPLSGQYSHPLEYAHVNKNSLFLRWLSKNDLVEPSFWAYKHSGSFINGRGSDYAEISGLRLDGAVRLWNAPPRAVYAFKELLPYGSLSITVKRPYGRFYRQYENQTATLDLVKLNADLAAASYGGLLVTDEVFTGDVPPYPGYIRRSGQILEGIRPNWTYQSRYPGQVSADTLEINFSAVQTGFQVAYSVDYGAI